MPLAVLLQVLDAPLMIHFLLIHLANPWKMPQVLGPLYPRGRPRRIQSFLSFDYPWSLWPFGKRISRKQQAGNALFQVHIVDEKSEQRAAFSFSSDQDKA